MPPRVWEILLAITRSIVRNSLEERTSRGLRTLNRCVSCDMADIK